MQRLSRLKLSKRLALCIAACAGSTIVVGAQTETSADPGSLAPPPLSLPSAPSDARPGVYYFELGVRAFKKKQYRFAVEMYRVAASWAYKPAQYNLGVMFFRGQGVAPDEPLGTAWMVLAAERGDRYYTRARDLMVTQLSNAQFNRTNALWKTLKPTFGDAVALSRARARWHEVRAEMTGSHVGGIAGNLSVGGSSAGRSVGGAASRVGVTAGDLIEGPTQSGSDAYRALQQNEGPYQSDKLTGRVTVGKPSQVEFPPAQKPASAQSSGSP